MALGDHGVGAMHMMVLVVEVGVGVGEPAFVNLAGEGEHSQPLAVVVRAVAGAPVMNGSVVAAAVLAVEGHVPNVTVVVLTVLVLADNGVGGGAGHFPATNDVARKFVEKHAEVD